MASEWRKKALYGPDSQFRHTNWVIPAKSQTWKCSYPRTTRYGSSPCKRCANCQRQIQNRYIAKMFRESEMFPHNYFLTLTYADTADVSYKQVQDYLKRIRKEKQGVTHHALRYFYVFELGAENHRPHHHLLVHTTHPEDLADRDNNIFCRQWNQITQDRIQQARRNDETPQDIFTRGFTKEREAYSEHVGYVAKYLAKQDDIKPRHSNGYGTGGKHSRNPRVRPYSPPPPPTRTKVLYKSQ